MSRPASPFSAQSRRRAQRRAAFSRFDLRRFERHLEQAAERLWAG